MCEQEKYLGSMLRLEIGIDLLMVPSFMVFLLLHPLLFPLPSYINPQIHRLWLQLSELNFLSSFPFQPQLSSSVFLAPPYLRASCVTLLMTLRKHAVSTSSKLPGHGYISWLAEPPTVMSASVIISQKREKVLKNPCELRRWSSHPGPLLEPSGN